jgi:hypothetical protein
LIIAAPLLESPYCLRQTKKKPRTNELLHIWSRFVKIINDVLIPAGMAYWLYFECFYWQRWVFFEFFRGFWQAGFNGISVYFVSTCGFFSVDIARPIGGFGT